MVRHRRGITQRLGLVFSVCKAQRTIKRLVPQRVSPTASIYAAATLEFLVAEALNSIIDQMNALRNHRITPRHVKLAFKRDIDFDELLDNIMIPHEGTLPNINVELLFSRHRLRMGKATRRRLEREESDEDRTRKANNSEDSDSDDDSDASMFTSLSDLPSGPLSAVSKRGSRRSSSRRNDTGKKKARDNQTTVDTASESEDERTFGTPSTHSSAIRSKHVNQNSDHALILVTASEADSDEEVPPTRSAKRSRKLGKLKKIGPPNRAIKGRRLQPPPRRRSSHESSSGSSGEEMPPHSSGKTAFVPGEGKSLTAVNKLVERLSRGSINASSGSEDDMADFKMDVDQNINLPAKSFAGIDRSDDDSDLDELSSSPPPSKHKGKERALSTSSPARLTSSRKAASSHASSLPDGSPPSSDSGASESERMTDLHSPPARLQSSRSSVAISPVNTQGSHSPRNRGAKRPPPSARTTPTNRRPLENDSEAQNSSLRTPLNTQEIDRLKTPSLNYSESPPSQSPAAFAATASTSRSVAFPEIGAAQYPPGFARKTLPPPVVRTAREVIDISSDEEGPQSTPNGTIIEIGSSDDDDEPVWMPALPTIKEEIKSEKETSAGPSVK